MRPTNAVSVEYTIMRHSVASATGQDSFVSAASSCAALLLPLLLLLLAGGDSSACCADPGALLLVIRGIDTLVEVVEEVSAWY